MKKKPGPIAKPIIVGIYRITSPSGRVNIGQSWNIDYRRGCYKRIACKGQRLVYASLKKYGWELHKFEILQEFPDTITQDYLDEVEILFIAQYKECGFEMMNIKEGGSKGKNSVETRKRISESNKGNRVGAKNPQYGKPSPMRGLKRSKEIGEKISKALTGRKHSDETKMKIGIIHKDLPHSEEAKKKISEGMKRVRAEEKKQGIVRKTWTDERKVYNPELLESIRIDYLDITKSTEEIAIKYNITARNLCNVIKRYLPECKRYKNRTWTKRH